MNKSVEFPYQVMRRLGFDTVADLQANTFRREIAGMQPRFIGQLTLEEVVGGKQQDKDLLLL
jgi:hypothetical protein